MNRKLVLLSLTVTLSLLLLGSAAGMPLVSACENGEEWEPICPPEDEPLYFMMDKPYLVAEPRIWERDGVYHMRGLVVAAPYAMWDDDGHYLPGVAYFTINGDANPKASMAQVAINIILDCDYGWWEGDVELTTSWADGNLLGYGTEEVILYGHCLLDCWTIHVGLVVDDDDFGLAGKIWNPCLYQWNPIAMPNMPMPT